jgi:3-oxoadipate enol-lactonase
MSQQDDFDRGVVNRRAVLGDAWVDQSLNKATEFNAEFQSLITRFAWNDIWGRPGLDHTTRRLLVLGMTMGMARWEEFELHCKASIRGGVPLDTIKEVLMQGAIYCGVPAANTAFKITTDILRAEGLLPAGQSLAADVRVSTHHTFSEPQLKVTVQGTGSPVVLSHALGLNLSMWDDLAAELATSHEVLRYDHRGHGGSAVPKGPYSMDDLVDDAARLIREWGRGPVVWVGLSMGGMVGQGLAIRHPELISKLVLANTAAKYPEASLAAWAQRIAAVETGGLEAIVNTVMERYFHAEFRATQTAAVAQTRATVFRTSAAWIKSSARR